MMIDRHEPAPDDEAPKKKKTAAKKKAARSSPAAPEGDGDEDGASARKPSRSKAGARKKAPATRKKAAALAHDGADDEADGDGATATKKKAGAKKKAGTAKKAASKKKAAATKKKAGARKAAAIEFDDRADRADDVGDVDPFIEGDDDGDGASGKALVVVESPAKAKTINKFLGKDFRVMASMGHVRDLPTSDLGIDIEHDFEPHYEPIPEKKKVIGELRKYAANAREIYLACDPDREGEAIAWHISQLLPSSLKRRVSRVTFNQITKEAVRRAFEAPRDIDMNKVNAQQARRVLDRIVGYKLSQLLWKKVRRGLSAGRVQSVAVKLVVERELEIRAFVPTEYWEVETTLESPRLRAELPPPEPGEQQEGQLPPWRFDTSLVRWRGERLDPAGARIANAEQAQEVEGFLAQARYQVRSVEQKERRNNARPPFITSTLQQSASSELSFGAQRTMRIAQGLYEGVNLGEEGAVGLITYMRTDSVSVAPEAIAEVREFIGRSFGANYVPEQPVAHKRGKQKVAAQEAHEAIRPTDVARTPEQMARFLEPDQLKLYTLIWRRFVASQMMPARFMGMTVEVGASTPGEAEDRAVLRATGSRLLFDGHLRVSGREQGDRLLPPLEQGEAIELVPPPRTQQKFTQPPARYTEASLIKKLEHEGIGRPSTYATIIQTIQDRGYVTQVNRALHATTKGEVVTERLTRFFGDIMAYTYTRDMETNLDRVEGAVEAGGPFDSDGGADETVGGAPPPADDDSGETLPPLDWRELLRGFYQDFSRGLEQAHERMPRVNEDPEVTDYPCPTCGAKMQKLYNTREFTQFLGCPQYPECKTRIPLDEEGKPAPEQKVDAQCHKCGKDLVLKSGRRGRFFACSGYPECKQTFEVGPDGMPVPKPDVEAPCPNCSEPMVVRRGRTGSFLGCSAYPKCRGTLPLVQDAEGKWIVGEKGQRQELPKVDVKCEACGSAMAIKRSRRGPFLGCTGYPKCRQTAKLPDDIKLPERAKPEPFGEDCEQCGKPLVIRQGRRGPFVSCSGYPGCRNTRNLPASAGAPATSSQG
ncbi:MAG: type I DNA topoisomerase [Planctomycetes bacterium]|nr:type I DNA topoisomerase [Planctomycetota bacterium]